MLENAGNGVWVPASGKVVLEVWVVDDPPSVRRNVEDLKAACQLVSADVTQAVCITCGETEGVDWYLCAGQGAYSGCKKHALVVWMGGEDEYISCELYG
ncbi:hypothetical protein C0991_011492 [Blastosporella zonata]|nr:hypothetical protein C0991_011492 [Blastosporella zonata]